MEPNEFERRRAVRIAAAQDVKAIIKSHDKILSNAKIADISTLGLGIEVDQDPGVETLHLHFLSPEILSGLKISANVRRKTETKTTSGKKQVIMGLEYIFTSVEQQNLMLRWLTLYFKNNLTAKDTLLLDEKDPAEAVRTRAANHLMVRFPGNLDELEQSFFLMQPLNVHHALIQTKIFLLIHQEVVAALVPLMVDTLPFRLPADEYFPEYVAKLREENRRLGEIAFPKFNENSNLLKAHPSITLRKLHILFSIFLPLIVYAKNFANLTDLLVLVPVHLQEFYRLWLFQDLTREVDVEAVGDASISECRFMRLDLMNYDECLASKRPELYEQLKNFERTAGVLNNFQTSYFPDKAFLEKWFIRKKQTLTCLSPAQKSYFKVLVPNLKL